jgi:hypothetical protein
MMIRHTYRIQTDYNKKHLYTLMCPLTYLFLQLCFKIVFTHKISRTPKQLVNLDVICNARNHPNGEHL